MSKIFARERRKIEKGEKKPRFRVVAATGDIKFFAEHIRKRELDAIAQAIGAEVVYLPTDPAGVGGEKAV
jgi:ABC-type branched-subunit amino acid transport system substrate-binding protein